MKKELYEEIRGVIAEVLTTSQVKEIIGVRPYMLIDEEIILGWHIVPEIGQFISIVLCSETSVKIEKFLYNGIKFKKAIVYEGEIHDMEFIRYLLVNIENIGSWVK